MRRRHRWFLAGGLVVCLLLAGLASGLAASSPDGLEHAAREGCTLDGNGEIVSGSCMARAERDHGLAGGPFAGYGVRGFGSGALGTGLAGVLGVLVTFGIGGGLFWLLRRRGTRVAAAERVAGAEPRDGSTRPQG